jgi:hypothetical protein
VTKFAVPENPGTIINFASETTQRPSASIAATVAVPIVHDWGPLGADEGSLRVNSFGEFDAVFGDSDTSGRRAVLGAFIGSGVPGQPGAGSVIVYRDAVAADAKKAALTVKNADDANALTLTARYFGERGDRLSIIIDDDPTTEANDRLRLLFDGLTVERYSYPQADIEALVAVINARSKWITATKVATGKALKATAGTSLAGGADGETLTGEEWAATLTALEFEPFSVFVGAALTDEAIQAAVHAWVQTQADQMRPIFAVFGGPADETLDEAITRTEDLRSPHVVSLGAGNFHDTFLGSDVNTAEIAPRVAGALAGLSEERSLTNLKFAGLSVIGEAAVPTDRLAEAKEAGITAFRRTSSAEAELKVNWGVTTYIDDTVPAMDPAIFGDPRLVRIIDGFIRGMVEWGDENIVGNTVVNEATKAAVRSEGRSRINALRDRGLILPGETEAEEPFFNVLDPEDVDAPLDSVPFEFGWKFGRTTNFLIGNGRVK